MTRPLLAFHLLFLLLLISCPLQAAGTGQQSGQQPTEPRAWVAPEARQTVIRTVALLPASENQDPDLLAALINGIESLGRYHLTPLSTSLAAWNRRTAQDHRVNLTRAARETGLDLGVSAVILAVTRVTGQDAPAPVALTMLDSRTGATLWRLHFTASTDQSLNRTVDRAMTDLARTMVKQGDIFSTTLPRPRVLSARGAIRSVRVIVQPDPPHVYSAYQLLRADNPDGPFVPVGQPVRNRSPLSLTDTGLKDATTYHYTVIGLNEQGFANVPGPPFAVTTTGPPPPVKGLRATDGGLRHVQLFWQPSQDPAVNGYVLLRGESPDGPLTRIAEINGREIQSYLDKGQPRSYSRYGVLKDGHRYFYSIRSRNVVGLESADAPVVSATTRAVPQPPGGLQAISGQPRRVTLAWTPATDPDVVRYDVYRADSQDGPWQQIGEVRGRETVQYVDEGKWDQPLADHATYRYRLQAVNVVGAVSMPSDEVSATTKAAPVPVRGVRAESGLLRRIVLHWRPNPEPDIDYYEIWRGEDSGLTDHRLARVEAPATSYTDQPLADGRCWWYRIRAVDRDGLAGELSTPVQASSKAPPVRPSGLRARIVEQGILLEWSANPEPDIDHYEVIGGGFLTRTLGRPQAPEFLYSEPVDPGAELRFSVRAVDRDGLKSAASEPLAVTTSDQ